VSGDDDGPRRLLGFRHVFRVEIAVQQGLDPPGRRLFGGDVGVGLLALALGGVIAHMNPRARLGSL
jgi:hypothetical protein